jgi:hypothetical protein
MILMKEVDPGLRTPTSSLYILSNFPAMVMIAPLLLLLAFGSALKPLSSVVLGIEIVEEGTRHIGHQNNHQAENQLAHQIEILALEDTKGKDNLDNKTD